MMNELLEDSNPKEINNQNERGNETNATDAAAVASRNHTKGSTTNNGDNNLNPKSKAKESKTGWRKYAGITFSLLASLSFTFATLSSKILTQRNYHPMNIVFWRCQTTTIFLPLFIIYLRLAHKQNAFAGIFEGKWRTIFFLLVRGSVGFLALTFYVYALQYIKLGDATVISFSTPVAVVITARLFLGEPCGIVPVIVALVSFSGVVVLTRPPLLTGESEFDLNTLTGTVLAFGSMLTVASGFVVTRRLRKVHFTLPVLFFGYVTAIEALIACLILDELYLPRTQDDWLITIGASFAALFGQILMTISLKYEEAGLVSLVRTMDIVFAFISQLVVLSVYPDLISILGASIVVFSIFFSAIRKWLSTLSEKHPARINCWFMLK